MERRKTEKKILECKKCHWKGKYILTHLRKKRCKAAYTENEINCLKLEVKLLKSSWKKARYDPVARKQKYERDKMNLPAISKPKTESINNPSSSLPFSTRRGVKVPITEQSKQNKSIFNGNNKTQARTSEEGQEFNPTQCKHDLIKQLDDLRKKVKNQARRNQIFALKEELSSMVMDQSTQREFEQKLKDICCKKCSIVDKRAGNRNLMKSEVSHIKNQQVNSFIEQLQNRLEQSKKIMSTKHNFF